MAYTHVTNENLPQHIAPSIREVIDRLRQQPCEEYEEFKKILLNAVTQKIKDIDRIQEVELKPDMYDKMLSNLSISRTQYEGMVHDLILREKLRAGAAPPAQKPADSRSKDKIVRALRRLK